MIEASSAQSEEDTHTWNTECAQMNHRRTVLCIRLSAIGDVIMLWRALKALHESGYVVMVVTSRQLLPVVSLFPFVKWTLTTQLSQEMAETKGKTPSPSTFGERDTKLLVWFRAHPTTEWKLLDHTSTLTLIQALTTSQPSLIDFQCTSRSRRARAILRATGVQWKHQFATPKRTIYRTARIMQSRLVGSPDHKRAPSPATLRDRCAATGVIARQLKVVEHLKRLHPPIPHHEEATLPHDHKNEEHRQPSPPRTPTDNTPQTHDILLFSGASLPLKRWPLENCLVFARTLVSKGYSLAYAGGPDEQHFGEQLARLVPGVVNTAGQHSLPETFDLIKAARCIVTTDSFPAHLCDLWQKPCIVLFGSTSPDFGFVPLSPAVDTLYSGFSCSPCTRHGRGLCRFGQTPCMRAHTGENIAERVTSLLEASHGE
jgi:ADP-heptose:LPS heptosyltransferase